MSKINKKPIIAIVTGGTGGHVFPALAVCDALIENGNTPLLIYDERVKSFVNLSNKSNVKNLMVPGCHLTGNLYKKCISIIRLITNIFIIGRFLKANKVTHIIGFGGYASFSGLLAARIMGIKIYLHEQNSVLGSVNKFFAKSSDMIFTSFPDTIGLYKKYLSKTKWVGNPIRPEIFNVSNKSTLNQDKFTIVIIGGSQGARILSEIPPLAIAQLPVNLQKRIIIYQQSRPELMEHTKALYKKTNTKFEIKPFYDNIFEILNSANLVICRAGSSTIFEIIALQKLSILVPFAAAKHNHQYYNAMYLVKNNAAYMLEEKDFSILKLTEMLKDLVFNPTICAKTSNNLKTLAKNNSSRQITQTIL